MMRMLTPRLLPATLVATSLLCVTSGAAQTDCATIPDPQQRLACYDALHAPVPAAEQTPEQTPERTAAETRDDVPESSPAAVPIEKDFGAEHLPQAAKAPRKPDAIHSRIVGRFDGWEEDTVFTLENGQQWRCAERSTASYRLPSPAVTIKRSWSGGYLMRVEGANRPVSVIRIR